MRLAIQSGICSTGGDHPVGADCAHCACYRLILVRQRRCGDGITNDNTLI